MPLAGRRAVLVVEDDPDAREVLELLLARRGHEVQAVATGEEGLELLRERAFDAVLTDQNLPGMSGTEMLDEAFAAHLVARDRVLICTAAHRVDGRGVPVMTKPIDVEAVARFVDGRRLHPELDRPTRSGAYPQR